MIACACIFAVLALQDLPAATQAGGPTPGDRPGVPPQNSVMGRASNGLMVQSGQTYIGMPVPRVPKLNEWLGAAALAGVQVSDRAVSSALEDQWRTYRQQLYARRDRTYDAQAARLGPDHEAPTPKAALEVALKALEELPRELRADSEGLKQAIYAAHAARPEDPPLDASRVERVAALASRKSLRRLFPIATPSWFPPAFCRDLEDDLTIKSLLWSGEEPLRTYLIEYERRIHGELLELAEAIRDYRRAHLDSSRGSPAEKARIFSATNRLWDLEARAVEELPITDMELLSQVVLDFRSLEHAARVPVTDLRLRLRAVVPPEDPDAAQCLAAMQAAADSAERAMAAAWRDRWMDLWRSDAPFNKVHVGRYQERMREALRTLGESIRNALALDRPIPPGAMLCTDEGREIAWVLEPIGSVGEDGVWQSKDLGPQWPDDLPGYYLEPRE